MLIPTIKDIIALPDQTALRAMRGRIKAVTEYKSRPDPVSGQIMTVQELFLEDFSGEVNVKVGNHPDLISMVGKDVVFLATQKVKGGFTGLKCSTDQKPDSGVYPCVRVSKGATIQEAVAEAPGQPAEQGPAVQQQTAPPQQPAPVQPTPAAVQTIAITQPTPQQPAKIAQLTQSPQQAQVTERMVPGPVDSRMCRVSVVSYKRTVNTGNYCSETMELTVEAGERTDIDALIGEIKAKISQHLPPEFIPPGGKVK